MSDLDNPAHLDNPADLHNPADFHRNPAHALAVVVLYRMSPADSPALQSLQAARSADPALSEHISLLIWDNTPGDPQATTAQPATPQPSPVQPLTAQLTSYHHDPTNPGLNAAYNAALQQAAAQGCDWLILLDQDTAVTGTYLREALAAAAGTDAAALVPRLIHANTIVSPFHPKSQGPVRPIPLALAGIAKEPLQAFNSGAVLRVSAMQALGGFDPAFPLDYLDHATFAALQQAGGKLYVLNATLQHDLSTHTRGALDAKALSRQADILAAEHRFVAKYGTPKQRRMAPIRTVRQALSVLVHKHDLRHALLILKTALARPR